MSTGKEKEPKGSEAFLSRWARVKEAACAQESSTTSPSATAGASDIAKQNTSVGAPFQPEMAEDAHPERTLPAKATPAELPPLDTLTPQTDYSPFMAKDVDPQLRNLAMKKLFADPHYNIMDRLDTYIDDYSTHPPLSLEVIRQMSISKSMRLFDDEEEEGSVAVPEPTAPEPQPQDESAAASLPPPAASVTPTEQPVESDTGEAAKQQTVSRLEP